ncbi:MAG: hypothetical protein D8H95_50130, partial [Lachnospiraceae bacterium]
MYFNSITCTCICVKYKSNCNPTS